MTLHRLGRWRVPLIAATSVLVALIVVAAILLLGNLPGDSGATPTPTATGGATEPPGDTPEAAVRAFFEAFAAARQSSDPSVIEPFVNGTDSSAYLTAAAFLDGQAEQDRASIVTVNELTNFDVEQQDDQAIVLFDHRLGGYDVDLDSRERLETPVVLPVQRKRVELIRVDNTWLVESFENVE